MWGSIGRAASQGQKPSVPPSPFAGIRSASPFCSIGCNVSWKTAARVPITNTGTTSARVATPTSQPKANSTQSTPAQTPAAQQRTGATFQRASSTGANFSWRQVFGMSGSSSQRRMEDEMESRKSAVSLRGSASLRPKHADYKALKFDPQVVSDILTKSHGCKRKYNVGGKMFECTHNLWADYTPDAIKILTAQRERFLALGSRQRGCAMYNAVQFPTVQDVLGESAQERGRRKQKSVIYTVGTIAALQREVCRFGFLAHYPGSVPTLNRMIDRKASGLLAYDVPQCDRAAGGHSVADRVER
eukprot:6201938-Pleurochrysis_carterae.AAC.1